MYKKIFRFSIEKPRVIVALLIAFSVVACLQFTKLSVDTDPENMLPDTAPVRVFNSAMKTEFALYDLIVVGVVNEVDENGVFNVETLKNVYEITEEIKSIEGVVKREIIAPSTKDNVEQDGVGAVRFKWLMSSPPETLEQALLIRDQAKENPLFHGTLISENGRALALYVPIERKDISYEVAQKIRTIVAKYPGDDQYHITGLPIANDQFGVEMFKQMAVSAPLAGLIIFLLMWIFFRSVRLIIAPMLVAMATVIVTMGLLIGLGYPVHIMSSMIPIFLMPIAVLDSIHILSEFFDKYYIFNDRKKTISFVVEELFRPMLFTSLTSAVGFFSLSFSPIPPVQVFGVFVAVGVIIAWLLTLIFIPAYVMLMNPNSFDRFKKSNDEEKTVFIDKVLLIFKKFTIKRAKFIVVLTVLVIGLSIYGITLIEVNDNPIRWFSKSHSIRVADEVLNKHFSGTYEAYLVFDAEDKEGEVFIHPKMLRYIEKLQRSLIDSNLVGKTTSLADVVKKIYYELLGGDKANDVVPNTKAAVAQCLIAFENSHKPDDLWHMTTPDYSKLNLWLQLKSGDNKDMDMVTKFVDKFIQDNPPPKKVKYNWAGLTYINVVWQQNMVVGMLKNFLGSFIIVFFMMFMLFKSFNRALLSMIPLSVTILFIYSLLGFLSKDYDMPVAVLSALTLGLSIDFAIHFIQRAIELNREYGNWLQVADKMFAGPGRAIIRNALVVAIGFLPLLAAPLIPYKTVGFFMFAIMAVSSVATLIIIPAIVSLLPDLLKEKRA